MPRQFTFSLQGLLRAYLGSLLVLVLVTAGLSLAWALVWQQSSQASLRLNGLLVEAQAVRGDLYRQMKEITRLGEAPSRDAYWRRLYRIDEHFYLMRQYADTDATLEAIGRMEEAYELIGVVLNRLAYTANQAPDERRIDELLNPAYDRWMTGDFEMAYDDLNELVADRRQTLQARLDRWLALAPWVSAVPLILAGLMVWRVSRRFRRGFTQPLESLVQGTDALGQGQLDYRVPEQGVAEIRYLARTLNRMARELEASRRELVERERQAALGALVPVIAHNIRNPLAGIRANAQLLDAEATSAEVLETGADIMEATDRLERWLAALLAYLHPLRLDPAAQSLDAVLEAAVAALGPRPDTQGVTIRRQGEDVRLNLDGALLEQALHGLMSNALEASPAGGRVDITLASDERVVQVHIDDQGPGMRIEPDPDARGPLPTTKKRGTGLGIPFAYKVVQAHGGQLRFEDRDGGGTRVTMILPRSGEASA